MTETATMGTNVNGKFLNEPMSDRTTVRHGWAEQIELGRAVEAWDHRLLYPNSDMTCLEYRLQRVYNLFDHIEVTS